MMSEKPLPSFRPIASPLDVDDAALEAINQKLGVPTLTRPAIAQNVRQTVTETPPRAEPVAAEPALPSPARAAAEKLTIEIPTYLGDAIRQAAVMDRKTARHVVMEALRQAGFRVDGADLVPDGRRKRSRSA